MNPIDIRKGDPVAAILIVDDSAFQRKRVLEALRPEGYTLQEAINGALALSALNERTFECVVTDLVMPEMDGFGLLAAMRERGIKTPVLVVTADIQKTTQNRCEELGARHIIKKPFAAADLRSAVAESLASAEETPCN